MRQAALKAGDGHAGTGDAQCARVLGAAGRGCNAGRGQGAGRGSCWEGHMLGRVPSAVLCAEYLAPGRGEEAGLREAPRRRSVG